MPRGVVFDGRLFFRLILALVLLIFLALWRTAAKRHRRSRFLLAGDVVDAIRELRRVMRVAGHLLFGLALRSPRRREPGIPVLFLLNALRVAVANVGRWAGAEWPAAGGSTLFVALIVPLFLPMEVWLWKEPGLSLEG